MIFYLIFLSCITYYSPVAYCSDVRTFIRCVWFIMTIAELHMVVPFPLVGNRIPDIIFSHCHMPPGCPAYFIPFFFFFIINPGNVGIDGHFPLLGDNLPGKKDKPILIVGLKFLGGDAQRLS